jgi:hypothetical protein
MDILNQKDRKLKIVFYVFSIGALFNILWVGYSTFSDKILTYLGFDSVKVRDFTGTYGYLIIIPGLIFTLGYYIILKKKIYGFEWIIIFSIILLIGAPVYIAATDSWGIQYR